MLAHCEQTSRMAFQTSPHCHLLMHCTNGKADTLKGSAFSGSPFHAGLKRQCRTHPTLTRVCIQQRRETETFQQIEGIYSQQWIWAFVSLSALAIGICYADRANIADAIIPMAKDMGLSRGEEGFILSSFFLGYGSTQMIGGSLADKFGGKRVLAWSIAMWSIATFLTPTFAKQGVGPLIAMRIMMGVGEGPAFPAVHSMISRAVPPQYQSTAVGAVTSASYLGSVAAFVLCPFIIKRASWESVFYVFGALGLFFLPLWALFPGQPLERKEESGEGGVAGGATGGLGQTATAAGADSDEKAVEKVLAEVRALLLKKEILAIVVAQYTQSWGLYGVMNWLPSYIEDKFAVPVDEIANFTVLPYALQGGIGLLAGVVADRWIARGMRVRQCRQLMQGVGMVVPAMALCAAAAFATSPQEASLYLTIGLGASALTLGGVSVNHLDIFPSKAGLVFGIGNTAGTLGGFISVASCGWLQQVTDSWAAVLVLIAAHYLLGALVWCLWVGDQDLDGATKQI